MIHKHHIIPRHAGGTDDPSNIVELTVAEHADAHWLLWSLHKNPFDKIAAQGLDGMIGKEGIIRQVQIANGKSRKGIPKSEAHKEAMSLSSRKSIIIDGVKYSSRGEAAKILGVAQKTINCWLNNGKLVNEVLDRSYKRIAPYSPHSEAHCRAISEGNLGKMHSNEVKDKIRKAASNQKSRKAKPVIINGVEYTSERQAAKLLGLTRHKLKKRLAVLIFLAVLLSKTISLVNEISRILFASSIFIRLILYLRSLVK